MRLADIHLILIIVCVAAKAMRDRVCLPKDSEGPFPAILVKIPRNFNRIEGAEVKAAIESML